MGECMLPLMFLIFALPGDDKAAPYTQFDDIINAELDPAYVYPSLGGKPAEWRARVQAARRRVALLVMAAVRWQKVRAHVASQRLCSSIKPTGCVAFHLCGMVAISTRRFS